VRIQMSEKRDPDQFKGWSKKDLRQGLAEAFDENDSLRLRGEKAFQVYTAEVAEMQDQLGTAYNRVAQLSGVIASLRALSSSRG